jgi:hypothetical protein
MTGLNHKKKNNNKIGENNMALQTQVWKENFDRNWKWQDTFTPQIQIILKHCFDLDMNTDTIEIASFHQDRYLGIDCIVKKQDKVYNIGLRVRNIDEWEFNDEFTIRYPSEYDKIFKGYLDKELYCFGDNNGNILKFTLIDLNVFVDGLNNGIEDEKTKPNEDPTNFKAYKFSKFPANLILYTRTRTEKIKQTLEDMKNTAAENISKGIINTYAKMNKATV